MTTRRTFLQLLLATAAAPSVVLAAAHQNPAPGARTARIIIKSETGMVSTEWVRDKLISALSEDLGLKAYKGQQLVEQIKIEIEKRNREL